MMQSLWEKIQSPFKTPRLPTILSFVAVVILALFLIIGSTRTYVGCDIRVNGSFSYEYFSLNWSDFTLFALSVTVAAVFVANAAYLLSSVVPRTKPLSESSAILLFSLSNVSCLASMVSLLLEDSRLEAYRRGIREMTYTLDSASGINVLASCWTQTNPTWFLVFTVLVPILILSVFAVRSIREQLENSGTPATIKDILQHGLQALKNLYHYGHVGIISTTDFVRTKVFTGDAVVMVRRRGDNFFREVSVPKNAQTSSTLNARVIDTLGLPQDAILTIIKNGEVLVDRDSDVSRLRTGDKLEVEVAGIDPNYKAEPSIESKEILDEIESEAAPLTGNNPPQRSRLDMPDV